MRQHRRGRDYGATQAQVRVSCADGDVKAACLDKEHRWAVPRRSSSGISEEAGTGRLT